MILRDPFLMRFIFYGFGDPSDAIDAIDQQMAIYKEQLKQRTENLGRWQNHDDYVRLMAELGVSFNTMIMEWLEKARSELSALDSKKQPAEPKHEVI